MRRREYLRSAVGAAGLAGLATTAPSVLGADDESPPTATSGRPTGRVTTAATSGRATGRATTTAADEFAPMARLAVGEGQVAETVTTPDGRYAFVATYSGFRVVDLADPESPEVVAGRDDILADRGPMSTVKDVKYNRGRLLVAADRGSPFLGVALFDVRDPTDPRPLGGYRTAHGVHNCDLHGDYAYLTAGSGLEIIDVSGEPRLVAEWSVTDYDAEYEDVSGTFRSVHDVYVQNERAYLAYWEVGTWILDVSDPTDPAYVGHAADYSLDELTTAEPVREYYFEPPGNSHYVQPSDDGTLLAVGREAWDVEGDEEEDDTGGPAGITLFDTTDASAPERLATIDPPPVPEGRDATYGDGYWTTAHNFDIVGDYLYSSWYRGGVKIHDISDPAAPEELAHWRDGEATQFWTAQVGVPGEYFVATNYASPDESEPTGLFVFPDPTDNPATVTPSGPPVDIATPTPTPTTAPTQTATATPTPTETPSPTATPTDSPAPTGTPTATDESTATNGSGPGFGPLAALAALGAGAWRVVRDGEE